MRRSDLCDFSDAYIFVKGTIVIEGGEGGGGRGIIETKN